jgi:hypothetical protein
MIAVIVSLFLGASVVTSVALIAACILSGRTQEVVGMNAQYELGLVPVESLRAIAEVELPKYKRARSSTPLHVGA